MLHTRYKEQSPVDHSDSEEELSEEELPQMTHTTFTQGQNDKSNDKEEGFLQVQYKKKKAKNITESRVTRAQSKQN